MSRMRSTTRLSVSTVGQAVLLTVAATTLWFFVIAFVASIVAEFMRERAVRAADLVTPNHFELDHLTGQTTRTLAEVLAAVDDLRARGPPAVLVTSLATHETPADAIDLLACDDAGRFRLRTPKLPIEVHGAGDAIAALFFAHSLRGASVPEAAARATSAIFGVLSRTANAKAREMLLIEAQEELVRPSRIFQAEPL